LLFIFTEYYNIAANDIKFTLCCDKHLQNCLLICYKVGSQLELQ